MDRLLAGLDLEHLERNLRWRPAFDQQPVELDGGHPEEPLLVDPHLVDEQHARIADEGRDLAGRVDLQELQLIGVAGVVPEPSTVMRFVACSSRRFEVRPFLNI